VNGAIFHFVHTPRLEKMMGTNLAQSATFKKYSRSMYYSGAISIVSWVAALILGGLRMIPVSVSIGLSIYIGIIVIAIIGAEIKRRQYLK
jgi:cellulose synthase/poly-beta-1,6-N-acetylglucosamine synthase-like glycosyltransferase